MLGILCQLWFGIALVFNLLWCAAVCKLASLLLSKKTGEQISMLAQKSAYTLSLFVTPWVRRTPDQQIDEEWSKIQANMATLDAQAAAGLSQRKPYCGLSNHTCFFDAILASTIIPMSVQWELKMYFDGALFKMPLVGTICRAAGFFPIYFTSSEEGKFTLDKEKNEQVQKDVDEHLKTGGTLAFFPEGTINKDPDTLLPFRLGGIGKLLEFDARLITVVSHNGPSMWPRKAKIGGLPARVRYSIRSLAPDGVCAYLAELRARPDMPEEDGALSDRELLAKYLRVTMQKQYDELREAAGGSAVDQKAGSAGGDQEALLTVVSEQ